MTSRQEAEQLDKQDSLAAFRDRFQVTGQRVYVDGNSLGRLPTETAHSLQRLITEGWGEGLVTSWDTWIDAPTRIGDLIGSQLVGASEGEVVISDSTSVNLFKLAAGALAADAKRNVIVSDRGNFPSDLYVFQGLAASMGAELRLIDCDPVDGPQPEDLQHALDDRVALVSFSHVNYRSGAIADMESITRVAHKGGALTLWDLSHSVGAVDVRLNECEADLAVGCTYKYLSGGPGAPAFLYVRRDLQDSIVPPIWGWFGQGSQFAFDEAYLPADGIRRFLVGTPPIISLYAIETGVRLIAEAGIEALREKSTLLTSMVIEMCDEALAQLGCSVGSPRDPEQRGSHIAIKHPDAYRICRALIADKDVIPDFREPNIVRYGVPPIYTTFVETWEAMERLRDVLEEGSYRSLEDTRARVT